MSVKIEILDYKHIKNNLLTWSNTSFTGFSTAGSGITAVPNNTGTVGILIESTAGVSGQYSGIDSVDILLQNNHSYTFTYTCSFVDNAGQVSSSVFVKGTGGGVNAYRPFGSVPITVGTHSYTFTMDTSQNNGVGNMDVYFQMTNGNLADKQVKISNVKLVSNSVLSDIDWENSVVGELDVTDHSDFPLAMTFQISDIKDLTSTSGDYSKTFKIPATKNNNKLLKHTYTPNIDTDVNLTENKKCRILINNLFSIRGLIKVTGVGGYGETPSYYNCVFFGSNLSWADDLSNKYMNELDWGVNGEDLEYNKTSIMATWQDEDCDSSTSPIVYPITSYGDYNPDGEPQTIQLLDIYGDVFGYGSSFSGYYGNNSGGNDYGTPKPSADWRPAVFVKDTLEKIFRQVGYTINSNFIATDMFKKLVWLLPNFKYNNAEEQYDEYSVESNFTNGVSMDATVYCSGVASTVTEDGVLDSDFGASVTYNDDNTAGGVPNYTGNPTGQGSGGTKLIPLDATRLNVTLDEGSYVDTTNDYITIGEYGYYDVKLKGLEARLANGRKGGGGVENINTIKVCVNLDVNTVGQTSWVTLERSEIEQSPLNCSGYSSTNQNTSQFSSYQNLSSIDSAGTWFNKGDKIRLTAGLKITSTSDNSQNYEMTTFTRSSSSSTFDISLNSEAVSYGQTYDLDKVISKDYKQIDFVKGIAHAFNLKMTTDETTKTVNIEPFDTFYKDYADAIDWTYKLDRSKQIEDKWIKSDLKRDVVFKYKTDSKDKKVERRGEEWFDGIKDEYPHQETLPKTFEKGQSKYENPFFAGTHNSKDQDTIGSSIADVDTAFSACLWTQNVYGYNENRPNKGYEFLPRLLYWNKYSPPTVAAGYDIKIAKVQTWSNTFGFLLANAAATSFTSNIYPQATSINRDDSSSPILSYGNVNVRDYDDATGAYTSYAAGKGLFETYYKNMFEMFKSKPRLRTLYIDLKTTDIINLDFRKLVYIDGVYWRINKVVDYQPNKNQPTKVELIEWLQLGAFAALAPSFGGNENTGGLGDVDIPDNQDIGL